MKSPRLVEIKKDEGEEYVLRKEVESVQGSDTCLWPILCLEDEMNT